MEIKTTLLPESQRKCSTIKDAESLPFGKLRSDHMLLIDYAKGVWKDARIVPYGSLSIMPGAVALHYGQSIFEGAKAFMHEDGELYAFRLEENAKRLNVSANQLCMPEIPVDVQVEGMMKLLDVERKWCPMQPESSLYVRPFMIGTEDALGMAPSSTYTFCVLLSPSGAYYSGGFKHAVRLLVTERYHRAVSGGTGSAKCCGNYGQAFQAARFSKKYDASQVLYLDASNQYIEEVGSMNHFHITKDKTVVIPEFTDSILRSITSLSVMELLPSLGYKVRQERVKITEFLDGIRSGEIIEAGGFGTAAVVTPVSEYIFENGDILTVGDGGIGENTRKIYEAYTAIQTGKAADKLGWLQKVPHFQYDLAR
ncbi:branched-chain amino acid aminotransferase [Denitrovibrio acetiphilus DSM 12809]|uniref:branched-chain-amino-acid transaminase n=1 Tax=Denitrovibrio acetiphilus (strain DSM 12809 / NBRC 114555 / N2460) TaxID=522772 RepID=D4H139_DENA2|nr:branched-chain amino acid aminotransferase [Denitrovibrio acetiphilus]ADD68702.1 branched-chain amino acid aminotransferase [Denitrovibrio acetiphilus DSM 12809]